MRLGRRGKDNEAAAGDRPTWRDRRRAARRDAGWMSSYGVRNDEVVWKTSADDVPCVVHDLSMGGAGLELTDAEVTVGDLVVIDLSLGSGRRASIQLDGRVQHVTPAEHGCVRVGVEFYDVGSLERALLQRLLDDLKRPKPEAVSSGGARLL
jgi:PilZ domain